MFIWPAQIDREGEKSPSWPDRLSRASRSYFQARLLPAVAINWLLVDKGVGFCTGGIAGRAAGY